MAGDLPRRLLVLGAGPAQLGLLEAARERGLLVIAVDRDPAAPGFRYADRRAIVSTDDEPAIQRLAEAENVDGVIAPGTDWPVGIAARVAERLALPHPIDGPTAVLSTSKLRQRESFAVEGVPHARWRLSSDLNGNAHFPVVVKAPDRQGKHGLTLVRERSELAAAIARAVAASRSGVCIVEELIEGPEVTVQGFSLDGRFHPLVVADRLNADCVFGVALAHVWPTAIEGAAEVAAQAVRAIGIENGPSYTRLRVGRDGPRVVELAARLGGGHDAELCRAAVGVDLNTLALAAALGDEIDEADLAPAPRVGGACVRFLPAPVGEVVATAGGAAERIEGVVWVRIYSSPERAGAVLAVGGSAHEALERATRAGDSVRFDVDERPPHEARKTA